MTKVTKEEIKKIAEMTKVYFPDDQLDDIVKQFNDVIAYAERVVEIAKQADMQSTKNINCDRPDIAIKTSNSQILAQAPQSEDNYFVVPKFVDGK